MKIEFIKVKDSLFLKVNVIRCIGLGFLCFILPFSGRSQNLIPNPSFEDFNVYTGVIPRYLDSSETIFFGVLDWFSPTLLRVSRVQSDSLENWSGNYNIVHPRTGQAHGFIDVGGNNSLGGGGLISSGKAFFQTRLVDTLEQGCYYGFSSYLLPFYRQKSLPSWSNDIYVCNQFGFYFSKERIRDTTGMYTNNATVRQQATLHHFLSRPIIPQVTIPADTFNTDTVNYTEYIGVFRAEGGERYMTMGNFYPMSMTQFKNLQSGAVISTTTQSILPRILSAFYVDDLSLIKVPPPDTMLVSSNDTVICPGDTLWLQAESKDTTAGVKWDDGSTATLRAITTPGAYWVELDCGCDITIRDTIVVTEKPMFSPLAINDTAVCAGEIVRYNFPTDLDYRLNGRAVGASFSIPDTGAYVLNVSDGCYDTSYTFNISHKVVEPLPSLNIHDTTLCYDEEWVLTLSPDFVYSLDGQIVNKELRVSEIGTYELIISNGCKEERFTFTIDDLGCEVLLFVPNAFTPDGDGVNDYFKVSIQGHEGYSIEVFNRWGQMVFRSTSSDNSWDGSFKGQITPGVYTYKIVVETGGGKTSSQGIVQVIR